MDRIQSGQEWPHKLLTWFDQNRRDLPWREGMPRNPYYVWVSEIMLQQTRTEAVKPYFESWKRRFPTIEALAEAEEADVLHAWQGLGYYSRARNLHKAAREIAEKYGGAIPEDKKDVRALPGIGEYTAGAILSMAYGKHEAAVDGNVLRVYARLYGIESDILKSAVRKEITTLVEKTLPARAGDFNEALMDLGSEVCVPKHPKCEKCPLHGECAALRLGLENVLPIRTPKKKQKESIACCAVMIQEGKALFHLRPSKGMLSSMWELPMVLSDSEKDGVKMLEKLLGGKAGERIWTYTHVFTHRIWHMKAYLFHGAKEPEGDYRWYSCEEYREIPLAGPHAKLAAYIEPYLEE